MTTALQASTSGKLTRHEEGSIKEVLHVSCPLMISYLSIYLMLFIDRLILGRFSNEAMNAVTTIGLVCFIFDYGLSGITAIVEVLVGKLNGAKEFTKMGIPVWQAIWLCIASFAVCVPLAFHGVSFLVPKIYQTIGANYYLISMLTCPFFGLGAALACFFIGQGKGYIVTIAIIISNILNLFLSLVLVFGYGVFPRLGVTGAAIATSIAQITQIIILGVAFFSKTNRTQYGCANWQFNYSVFKNMLSLGLPNSLSHMLEIAAWVLVSQMLATVSNEQVTLFSVGQSLFFLLAFFSEGLQKGVMAISSNFVGAKKYHLIAKNISAATYVHLIFCAILLVILLGDNNFIIKMFFPEISGEHINCLWVLLYFALDGLVWIRSAVLTSFGDTKFIMLANVIGVAIFAVLPIYILIVRTNGSLMFSSWQLVSVSALVNLLVFYCRSQQKLNNLNLKFLID